MVSKPSSNLSSSIWEEISELCTVVKLEKIAGKDEEPIDTETDRRGGCDDADDNDGDGGDDIGPKSGEDEEEERIEEETEFRCNEVEEKEEENRFEEDVKKTGEDEEEVD